MSTQAETAFQVNISKKTMSKKRPPKKPAWADQDPHAAREAEKYARPIPSRELIIEKLTEQGVPLSTRVNPDGIPKKAKAALIEALKKVSIAADLVTEGRA